MCCTLKSVMKMSKDCGSMHRLLSLNTSQLMGITTSPRWLSIYRDRTSNQRYVHGYPISYINFSCLAATFASGTTHTLDSLHQACTTQAPNISVISISITKLIKVTACMHTAGDLWERCWVQMGARTKPEDQGFGAPSFASISQLHVGEWPEQ